MSASPPGASIRFLLFSIWHPEHFLGQKSPTPSPSPWLSKLPTLLTDVRPGEGKLAVRSMRSTVLVSNLTYLDIHTGPLLQTILSPLKSEVSASCISPPKNPNKKECLVHALGDFSFMLLDLIGKVKTIFILMSLKIVSVLILIKI